jgi:IclR family pca regulon transcriptional regulator
MEQAEGDGRNRDVVAAFARGLDVIQAFAPDHARLTLSEVAQRAGIDRAVARRLLLTLVQLGFARQDGRHFALTAQILRLADSYLATTGFERLQPALEALSRRLGLNVSLTVLDYPDIVHVARAEARDRSAHVALRTAQRMPATATASGRVLLAELAPPVLRGLLERAPLPRFTAHSLTTVPALMAAIATCRQVGHAVVDGELEVGFVAAAVPLRDAAGRLVSALATSSPMARLDAVSLVREVVPLLQEAALQMGSTLRGAR